MWEAFRNGGFGMIPTLLFGALLVTASVRYARSGDPQHVPSQLALGVLTLASGGFGFVAGMITTLAYVGTVGPDGRWVWMVGLGESLNNLALALLLVMIAAIAASLGTLRQSPATRT